MPRRRSRVTVHGEGPPVLRLAVGLNPCRYSSVAELRDVLSSELQTALGRPVAIPPGTHIFYRPATGPVVGPAAVAGGLGVPLRVTTLQEASRGRRGQQQYNQKDQALALADASGEYEPLTPALLTPASRESLAPPPAGIQAPPPPHQTLKKDTAGAHGADPFADFVLLRDAAAIEDGAELLIDEWAAIVRAADDTAREEEQMRTLAAEGAARRSRLSASIAADATTTPAGAGGAGGATGGATPAASTPSAAGQLVVVGGADSANAMALRRRIDYAFNLFATVGDDGGAPGGMETSAFASRAMSPVHQLLMQKLLREVMLHHIRTCIFLSSQCSREVAITAQDVTVAQGQNGPLAEGLLDEVTVGARICDPVAALRAVTQLAVQRGKQAREYSDGAEAERMRQLASGYRGRIARLEEALQQVEAQVAKQQALQTEREVQHANEVALLKAEVRRLETVVSQQADRSRVVETSNAFLQKSHHELSALNERLYQDACLSAQAQASALVAPSPGGGYLMAPASAGSGATMPPRRGSMLRSDTPRASVGDGGAAVDHVARRVDEERFQQTLQHSVKHTGRALLEASALGYSQARSPRSMLMMHNTFDSSSTRATTPGMQQRNLRSGQHQRDGASPLGGGTAPWSTTDAQFMVGQQGLDSAPPHPEFFIAGPPLQATGGVPPDATALHPRSLLPAIGTADKSDAKGRTRSITGAGGNSPAVATATATAPELSIQLHVATLGGATHVVRFQMKRPSAHASAVRSMSGSVLSGPHPSTVTSTLMTAVQRAVGGTGPPLDAATSTATLAQQQQMLFQQRLHDFYTRDLGPIVLDLAKKGGRGHHAAAAAALADPSLSFLAFYATVMWHVRQWQLASGIAPQQTPHTTLESGGRTRHRTSLTALSEVAGGGRTRAAPCVTHILAALPAGTESGCAVYPVPDDDPSAAFLLFFRLYYVRNGQRLAVTTDDELEALLQSERAGLVTVNCVEVDNAAEEFANAMLRRGDPGAIAGTPSDETIAIAGPPKIQTVDDTADPMFAFWRSTRRMAWETTVSAVTSPGADGVPTDAFGVPISQKPGSTVGSIPPSGGTAPTGQGSTAGSPAGNRKPFFAKRSAAGTPAQGTAKSGTRDGTQQGGGGGGDPSAMTTNPSNKPRGEGAATDDDPHHRGAQGQQGDGKDRPAPLFPGAGGQNVFLHASVVDVPGEAALMRAYGRLIGARGRLPEDFVEAMQARLARRGGDSAVDDFFAATSDQEDSYLTSPGMGPNSSRKASHLMPSSFSPHSLNAGGGTNPNHPSAGADDAEAVRPKFACVAEVLRYLHQHHETFGEGLHHWRIIEHVLATHGILNDATGASAAAAATFLSGTQTLGTSIGAGSTGSGGGVGSSIGGGQGGNGASGGGGSGGGKQTPTLHHSRGGPSTPFLGGGRSTTPTTTTTLDASSAQRGWGASSQSTTRRLSTTVTGTTAMGPFSMSSATAGNSALHEVKLRTPVTFANFVLINLAVIRE